VAAATAMGEEDEPGLDLEESTNFMAMPPTELGEHCHWCSLMHLRGCVAVIRQALTVRLHAKTAGHVGPHR
jgi:hypothetical protein